MSLLTILGLWLSFSVVAEVVTPKARASAKQDTIPLNLEVIAAWIPNNISVNRNTVNPAEGHIFVVLQAKPIGVKSFLAGTHRAIFDKDLQVVGIGTYPDEGGHIYSYNAVLADSSGGRYIPIGGVSGLMAFFRNKSVMADLFKIELSNGSLADYDLLIYVYEIPLGRSGFKLTVGNWQPMPIEVITR